MPTNQNWTGGSFGNPHRPGCRQRRRTARRAGALALAKRYPAAAATGGAGIFSSLSRRRPSCLFVFLESRPGCFQRVHWRAATWELCGNAVPPIAFSSKLSRVNGVTSTSPILLTSATESMARPAAIDNNIGARYKSGAIRAQKCNQLAHLFRRAETGGGNV
jgi:hypothetical protein